MFSRERPIDDDDDIKQIYLKSVNVNILFINFLLLITTIALYKKTTQI